MIKSLIKESHLYKKIRFWAGITVGDFFNFEKLILFKKVYPYTMAGYKRLSNVYQLAEEIEKHKLEGAFIECGVWRGGCSAIMAYVAKKHNSKRKIWLFDSFEGLPEPTQNDGLIAKGYAENRTMGELKTINKCVASLEDVEKIFFNILKINPEHVVIKKGWFQNTLPEAKGMMGKVSMLRLDGDWYESTKCCLENLYDNVIVGGYIIIDDYGHWEGCKKAVDEFLTERNINPKLIKIDETGVYFQKLGET